MGSIGWSEIMIILFAVLMLFGTKKLPEVGRSLGKAIKEFKSARDELIEDLNFSEEEEVDETGEKSRGHPA
ncbi:twin-arginine translocase TatA/TatE family subunit [Candidatus Poribacteria bacterium]|nr:twin-arginine translocase TatA/TatE family subunit [Candidatus Poribacteria bacterium]